MALCVRAGGPESSTGEAIGETAAVLVCMFGSGSGTIRRCGLDGVGVAFLEEVCHCGDGQ